MEKNSSLKKVNPGCFQKGNPGFWLGKKRENISGPLNCNWKGDNVGYYALHSWVKRHLGTPMKCEMCGTETAKQFDWANKSQEYKREKSDWLRLCGVCHKKHDKERYPPVWNTGLKGLGICKSNKTSFTSERATEIQLRRWANQRQKSTT